MMNKPSYVAKHRRYSSLHHVFKRWCRHECNVLVVIPSSTEDIELCCDSMLWWWWRCCQVWNRMWIVQFLSLLHCCSRTIARSPSSLVSRSRHGLELLQHTESKRIGMTWFVGCVCLSTAALYMFSVTETTFEQALQEFHSQTGLSVILKIAFHTTQICT